MHQRDNVVGLHVGVGVPALRTKQYRWIPSLYVHQNFTYQHAGAVSNVVKTLIQVLYSSRDVVRPFKKAKIADQYKYIQSYRL
jgi:hypothetical protein